MATSHSHSAVKTAEAAEPAEVGHLPATSRQALDDAVNELAKHRKSWSAIGAARRAKLIDELIASFSTVAGRWVDACLEAEGIPAANPLAGEEWLAGPYLIFRNLRMLRNSLRDIARHGRPRIPGPVTTRDDGQVVAQVIPANIWDRLFYSGVTAEVWMEPGVVAGDVPQAASYRHSDQGGVALVLSAGNVSSIGPMDTLYKLFVDNRVVIFKVHQANDYLGPLFEEGFAPLVKRGFLRVVYGGAQEGGYLCEHPAVDEIHVTGSDKTVEAIAFGSGAQGAANKAARRPKLDKKITSELGNVSPWIVVPGPWSASDLRYQAENIVSSLANNAGFNCNATRMLITHAGWDQRAALLDEVRRLLAVVPTRRAYYPGAQQRWSRFVEGYEQSERFGESSFGRLPWTLIPDLDPNLEDDLCQRAEAFCSVMAETALPAADTATFLAAAVNYANERLWGTLNVTLVIHPTSLRDPAVAAAFDRAVADLRYGTVAINHWAAIGYGMVATTWGAFPGADLYDIQSGTGVVHNSLMFDRPQKSILRAPFRATPKPPWFISNKKSLELGKRMTRFEIDPSPFKLPGIFAAALTG